MDELPEHVRLARAAVFRAVPEGQGGRCAYCNADHRFGPDWWPRAEREAHVVAVAEAGATDLKTKSVSRNVATLCAVRIEEQGLGFAVKL